MCRWQAEDRLKIERRHTIRVWTLQSRGFLWCRKRGDKDSKLPCIRALPRSNYESEKDVDRILFSVQSPRPAQRCPWDLLVVLLYLTAADGILARLKSENIPTDQYWGDLDRNYSSLTRKRSSRMTQRYSECETSREFEIIHESSMYPISRWSGSLIFKERLSRQPESVTRWMSQRGFSK